MLTQLSPSILTQPNSLPTHFSPTTHPFLTQSNPTQCSSKCSPDSHPIMLSFLPNCHPFSPNRNQPNSQPMLTQYSHPTMPNTQLLTRPIFHTIEPNPILIKILTQFSPNCNMIISQYSSFFPHIHVILTKI